MRHVESITVERLESRAQYVPESGCLIWDGWLAGRGGYGRLRQGQKAVFAHRAMFELTHRPLIDGELVCHKCDTPSCINPNHLFAASNDENMADMVAKRRQSHGEKHASAILTDRDVVKIRASKETSATLAYRYKVSVSAVKHIRKRRTWRHLQ